MGFQRHLAMLAKCKIRYEAMSLWSVRWAVPLHILAMTLPRDTDEVSN